MSSDKMTIDNMVSLELEEHLQLSLNTLINSDTVNGSTSVLTYKFFNELNATCLKLATSVTTQKNHTLITSSSQSTNNASLNPISSQTVNDTLNPNSSKIVNTLNPNSSETVNTLNPNS
uniref:Uncharacterized protein n=1 Tax=Cacopsylla melanoneura TaxID=428564 RepID=A0A8D8Q3Z5_9HEMI